MKLLLSFCLAFLSINLNAQNTDHVELMDMVSEIQNWDKSDDYMSLTFWIPQSYWRVALKDSPDVNPEIISRIEEVFEDYVFLIALHTSIDGIQGMDFMLEKDMRKSIEIIDENGKRYKPLEEEDIKNETLLMAATMKPMFIRMFGQMGQGMHFYFFKVEDKKGNQLINEFEKGKFSVEHSEREFVYNLPLPSLLPLQKCPEDGAEMQGNWNFCPFHGVALKEEN